MPKPMTGRGRALTLTKAQPGWNAARRKPMKTLDSAFGLGIGRMASTLRETERAINSGVTVTSDTLPLMTATVQERCSSGQICRGLETQKPVRWPPAKRDGRPTQA